mmetsp:Transcript_37146/g.106304  ORF Transcript_37146/g.106304 Transcript_37146/m.106304 type:complete len:222 (-) Transcript_37146:14-679(-)
MLRYRASMVPVMSLSCAPLASLAKRASSISISSSSAVVIALGLCGFEPLQFRRHLLELRAGEYGRCGIGARQTVRHILFLLDVDGTTIHEVLVGGSFSAVSGCVVLVGDLSFDLLDLLLLGLFSLLGPLLGVLAQLHRGLLIGRHIARDALLTIVLRTAKSLLLLHGHVSLPDANLLSGGAIRPFAGSNDPLTTVLDHILLALRTNHSLLRHRTLGSTARG